VAGCWAIRGATTTEENTREAILAATKDLLTKTMEANNLDKSQVAAVWFTTTQDLNAEFPALAARQLGWMNVALMCAHEMAVPGSLPRCIRVLILVNTDKNPQDLEYIYLENAASLRTHSLDC
jgi:chorismate mutase